MKLKKKHCNIPIFIPELACPHRCIFCDQNKISGSVTVTQPYEISQIIENYLRTIPKNRDKEIAFFGGSFTGIQYSLQEEYLREAYKFVKNKSVSGIRLSTRPDYIDDKILSLLKKYGVTTVELGAQSTDDYVLKKSGRGHNYEDIKRASKLILSFDIKLGLQMMIGLPEDTLQKSIKTAIDIVSLNAESTRIYPTLVVKGTLLETLFKQGKYKPLYLNEATIWTKEVIKIFDKNNINVIRVGLHPSEELNFGKSLIAGPYHHSFRELVNTEIWHDIIMEQLEGITNNEIYINVNNKQLNYAIGYKKRNINLLLKNGNKVKFIPNPNIEKYEMSFKLKNIITKF